MNADVRYLPRLFEGAVLLATLLAVVLASRWVISPAGPSPALSAAEASSSAVRPLGSAGSVPVVLAVGDAVVTATLDDTAAARQFAAMLPLELDLHDAMAQAKAGQLDLTLDVTGADLVFDPTVGEIYYWPPSGDVAIFYDDLGQRVPPPGMVQLGVVENGLDAIASAGNRFTMRIDRG